MNPNPITVGMLRDLIADLDPMAPVTVDRGHARTPEDETPVVGVHTTGPSRLVLALPEP